MNTPPARRVQTALMFFFLIVQSILPSVLGNPYTLGICVSSFNRFIICLLGRPRLRASASLSHPFKATPATMVSALITADDSTVILIASVLAASLLSLVSAAVLYSFCCKKEKPQTEETDILEWTE